MAGSESDCCGGWRIALWRLREGTLWMGEEKMVRMDDGQAQFLGARDVKTSKLDRKKFVD